MTGEVSTLKIERRSVAERRRLMVVFGALMLAMLIAALDQTIVSTCLLYTSGVNNWPRSPPPSPHGRTFFSV